MCLILLGIPVVLECLNKHALILESEFTLYTKWFVHTYNSYPVPKWVQI